MLLLLFVLLLAPDTPKDAHKKGLDLYKQQKYAEAIQVLEHAASLEDPKSADYKESVLDSIPLHRIATTDDIALSICFLLSDWSRHITGEILNINGGSVMFG